jgi:hypothetical protein
MCCSWWHYHHSALLANKIRNLNGFEFRYFNGLKVLYYCKYPPLSRKSYFHGHDTLPLHGETLSAIEENNQKLNPKDSTYNSLKYEVEKKDQR